MSNFRDNGWFIHAAIENSGGSKWLMDLTLCDNGELDEGRFYQADTSITKNWWNNCKSIAALKEEVRI